MYARKSGSPEQGKVRDAGINEDVVPDGFQERLMTLKKRDNVFYKVTL